MAQLEDKLIDDYEKACNDIVKAFEEKQGCEFTDWIGIKGISTGSIACFIDQYYFNMEDLILDLKTDQPKGFIFEWHDKTLKQKNRINYSHYIMGAR